MGLSALLAGCAGSGQSTDTGAPNKTPVTDTMPTPSLTKTDFGQVDGQAVQLYTLRNAQGGQVQITNYGGIVTSWLAPDKNGQLADVALGFDSLGGYLAQSSYLGAIVGRYGNRIAKGSFKIGDKTYTLATNNAPNHLHGGKKGFDRVVWQATEIQTDSTVGLRLNYLSKDGEEGYPGNLSVEVTYLFGNDHALRMDYRATTDQPTVVNLTNHTYFNLTGGRTDALGHVLMLKASQFLPVDKTLIPTGKPMAVAGTPFDFTAPKAIGERIGQADAQLKIGNGYDHCWVLDRTGPGLELVASAADPLSGRVLEVLTTEPGLQFYSGNFLNGSMVGKGGIAYPFRHGFCLETQHYPDSPNQPAFPSVLLLPGQTYQTTTVYRMAVR
jgi:aldose 1-epimerase